MNRSTACAGRMLLQITTPGGFYAGQCVETQIAVSPSGDGTGDAATHMLWLSLVLLADAGLAASAVARRRKRQNG